MGRLEGKIAVITGASSGYGRTMARMFAKEGAKIACFDITTNVGVGFEEDDDYADPTHIAIQKAGGDAIYVTCDVSDPESVKAAFEKVDEDYGGVDILVNNAGIWKSGVMIDEQNGSFLRKALEVNVLGSYYCAQQALKRMRAQGRGGRVLQMASTASVVATAFESNYDITKGAVIMLMKSIAAEYSQFQITSNAICPAYGYTPMGRRLIENPIYREAINSSVPLGKWVHPKDVGYYAIFLASDESGHVSGTSAIIDGGQRAVGGGNAVAMRGLFAQAGLDDYYTTVH